MKAYSRVLELVLIPLLLAACEPAADTPGGAVTGGPAVDGADAVATSGPDMEDGPAVIGTDAAAASGPAPGHGPSSIDPAAGTQAGSRAEAGSRDGSTARSDNENTDVDELHEQIFADLPRRDPEHATHLGLSDRYGIPEDQLTDVSESYRLATDRLLDETLTQLRALDRASMTAEQQVANDVLLWDLEDDLRGRDEAREALGDRFDLAEFHTVVLRNGQVPLAVLEDAVDAYVEAGLNDS